MSLKDSIDKLKIVAPLDKPFVVLRKKLCEEYGSCELIKGKYVITIHKGLSEQVAIESLLHEWAHAMIWREREAHGPLWGVCYAKLWSEFYD